MQVVPLFKALRAVILEVLVIVATVFTLERAGHLHSVVEYGDGVVAFVACVGHIAFRTLYVWYLFGAWHIGQ